MFTQYLHYFTQILTATLLFFVTFYVVKNINNRQLLQMFIDMHIRTSKFSWTRGAGTLVILATLCLAFYQVYKTGTAQESLIVGLILVAFGGKVGQKFAENKQTSSDANKTSDIL